MTLFPGLKLKLIRWCDTTLAEQLAAEIEGSIAHPAALCNGVHCPCCAQALQAARDAEMVLQRARTAWAG